MCFYLSILEEELIRFIHYHLLRQRLHSCLWKHYLCKHHKGMPLLQWFVSVWFGFVSKKKGQHLNSSLFSSCTSKKKVHHLPWEVQNRKANSQVSQNGSKVKQTEFYRNTLTMTEGFNNAAYLKNCMPSSCRYESYLCPQLKAQDMHWHTTWDSS